MVRWSSVEAKGPTMRQTGFPSVPQAHGSSRDFQEHTQPPRSTAHWRKRPYCLLKGEKEKSGKPVTVKQVHKTPGENAPGVLSTASRQVTGAWAAGGRNPDFEPEGFAVETDPGRRTQSRLWWASRCARWGSAPCLQSRVVTVTVSRGLRAGQTSGVCKLWGIGQLPPARGQPVTSTRPCRELPCGGFCVEGGGAQGPATCH